MSEPTISLPGFSDTEQCDENEDNFRSDVDSTQLKGPLTTSKEYFLTGKKNKTLQKGVHIKSFISKAILGGEIVLLYDKKLVICTSQ